MATPQPKTQTATQTPKKNLFSRCWASLGKAWTDKMTPKIKKVVDYLEERSEVRTHNWTHFLRFVLPDCLHWTSNSCFIAFHPFDDHISNGC